MQHVALAEINRELHARGYVDTGYYDGLLARRAGILMADSEAPRDFSYGVTWGIFHQKSIKKNK